MKTPLEQNTVIRAALSADLLPINSLLRISKAYWGYDTEFMDKFMALFALTEDYLKQNILKVLMIDTTFVGFYSFRFAKEGALELDHFFIHPAHLGQGLGKKLWQDCCETAQSLHQAEFVLWSDPHAAAFYEKMGCETIGERASPLLPNRACPLMRFRLAR